MKRSLLNHGVASCALDSRAFVFAKQKQIIGVSGVLVDDLLGGGDEVFDRTISEVQRESGLGAWDVGAMRFRGSELTRMANDEIVIDMEHYEHELQQIDEVRQSQI